MQLALGDACSQGLARSEDVPLPDVLRECSWAHAVGQRPQGIAFSGGGIHGNPRRPYLRGVPMTSTFAGAVKLTSPGETSPLRTAF